MNQSKSNRAQITKPKTVFKGIFHTIKQAKAIYPSGTIKTFEYHHGPTAVAVLAFDRNYRLLLTQEYREAAGRTEWRLPAGRVDKGDSFKVAAQKELRQETGFRAKRLGLFKKSMSGGSLRLAYIAFGLSQDPLPKDEGEEIKIIPTSLKKAYLMALNGTIKNDFIALSIIQLYHQAKKVGLKKFLRSH